MGGILSKRTTSLTQPPAGNGSARTTQEAGAEHHVPSDINSNYNELSNAGSLCGNLIHDISSYLCPHNRANYALTSRFHRNAIFNTRRLIISRKLLSAVAYGMESARVNVNPVTGLLFVKDQALIQSIRDKHSPFSQEELALSKQLKTVLFADELLKQSPEYMTEQVPEFTDWSGRTFKYISPLEYAVWAKDFQMIRMFLSCDINKLVTVIIDNDSVRLPIKDIMMKQWARVVQNGLSYDLTYNQPVFDPNGIPAKDEAGRYQTTRITERHTNEHHFDMSKSIADYHRYLNSYAQRTPPDNNACWSKVIGTHQRLFPLAHLQRFCCPDTQFSANSRFTEPFTRSTRYHDRRDHSEKDLLLSSLSSDFALCRGIYTGAVGSPRTEQGLATRDVAAIEKLDSVNTCQTATLQQRLMAATQDPTIAVSKTTGLR